MILAKARRAMGRRGRAAAAYARAGWLAGRERLVYHRRELVVLGLVGASLAGGLAVEVCRRRAPGLLERLEAEPAVVARGSAAPRLDHGRRPPARAGAAPPAAEMPAGPPAARSPLDLNRATADELDALPGIGPRLAARIVATREALGGRFASPDDLARVPGLGPRRLAALRSLVSAGSPIESTAVTRPAEAREPP